MLRRQTTYTAIGQVGQLSRPGTNALYSTYGYDNATGAVTEIKDGTLTAGVYTVQADRQYTRDNAGDVTKAVTTGTVGAGGLRVRIRSVSGMTICVI